MGSGAKVVAPSRISSWALSCWSCASELAELSNTTDWSLSYDEEQGLIIPLRFENGYRDYEPYMIDRAIQIRGLIDSGILTTSSP